jgi:hypothetical protein
MQRLNTPAIRYTVRQNKYISNFEYDSQVHLLLLSANEGERETRI